MDPSDFYRTHSRWSDPGRWAGLLAENEWLAVTPSVTSLLTGGPVEIPVA